MSTLTETARSAAFRSGFIVMTMKSGAKLSFPIPENSRLARGTPEQLNNIEISPFGLHWPDLDEDLSIRGIAEETPVSFWRRLKNAAKAIPRFL